MKQMRILVFGAGGHVARCLIRLCTERHLDVVAASSSGAHHMRLDFLDQDAVRKFMSPEGPPFDAVVFAQGINPSVGISDVTYEYFVRMLTVNVVSPALLVDKLRDHVRPGGCFIFLGSVAAARGSFDPAYGAAKAALAGLISSLARYDRDRRYLVVSPALIEGSPVAKSMPPERRALHSSSMTGGKLVDGDDVARCILECVMNQSLSRVEIRVDRGIAE